MSYMSVSNVSRWNMMLSSPSTPPPTVASVASVSAWEARPLLSSIWRARLSYHLAMSSSDVGARSAAVSVSGVVSSDQFELQIDLG